MNKRRTNRKGQSIIALLLISSFVFFTLSSVGLLIGSQNRVLSFFAAQGSAASYAGESGIARTLQIMMEGFYDEIPQGSPYFNLNNTTGSNPYAYISNTWRGKTIPLDGTSLTLPSTPESKFRVSVASVEVRNGPGGLPGALVTFDAIGQAGGEPKRVVHQVWVYDYANPLGEYLFLTRNKFASCTICHMQAEGNFGEMAYDDPFKMWASYDTTEGGTVDSRINGNFYSHSSFERKSEWDHRPNQQNLILGDFQPDLPRGSSRLPDSVPDIHIPRELRRYIAQGLESGGSITEGMKREYDSGNYRVIGNDGQKGSPVANIKTVLNLPNGPQYGKHYTLDGRVRSVRDTPIKITCQTPPCTVVIDGDLIINGQVRTPPEGGKIVSTRNIYIVGDLTKFNSSTHLALMAAGSIFIGGPFDEYAGCGVNCNVRDDAWINFVEATMVDKHGTPVDFTPDRFLSIDYAMDGRRPETSNRHNDGSGNPETYVQPDGTVRNAWSSGDPPQTPGLLPLWFDDIRPDTSWISQEDFVIFQGTREYVESMPKWGSEGITWVRLPPGHYTNTTARIDAFLFADYAIVGVNPAEPDPSQPGLNIRGGMAARNISILPARQDHQQPNFLATYDSFFSRNPRLLGLGNLVNVVTISRKVLGTDITLP